MIAHYKDIVGAPNFLTQLSEIGHYPQVEAPDEVAKYYRDFLNQVKRA